MNEVKRFSVYRGDLNSQDASEYDLVDHTQFVVLASDFDALAAQLESETKLHLEDEARHDSIVLGLKDQLAEARAELANVLADWNAIVQASGSKTNGGAVAHVRAVVAERDEARAELAAVIKLAAGYQRDADALRAAVERHNAEATEWMKVTGYPFPYVPLPAAAQGSACDHMYAGKAGGANSEFHCVKCGAVQPEDDDERGRAGAEPKPFHSFTRDIPGMTIGNYCTKHGNNPGYLTCPHCAGEQQSTAPEGDIK